MSHSYKHILITGGAGFVGSSLALNLRANAPSLQITAFDNLKRRGSELNLPRLKDAGIVFVHGDVRNREDLSSLNGVDCILECSAEPSVLAGYGGSPDYLLNTNLLGTINCLELARATRADMIFLSTSRVYPIAALNGLSLREENTRFVLSEKQPFPGASAAGISEEFPLEGARSLYGTSKLCSELLIQEYIAAYGLRAIINRCGVIAGPWQMGKVDQGVAVLWAARHVFGGKLDYIGYGGRGKQVRDMLHIDDLFDLISLELNDIGTWNAKTFNVGGGAASSASLCELTRICEELSENRIQIGSNPEVRAGDVPLYITDNTRVSSQTGWAPTRGIEQIMRDIEKWLRANERVLRPILE
jgi:CDP-paratose 2-epimerase